MRANKYILMMLKPRFFRSNQIYSNYNKHKPNITNKNVKDLNFKLILKIFKTTTNIQCI